MKNREKPIAALFSTEEAQYLDQLNYEIAGYQSQVRELNRLISVAMAKERDVKDRAKSRLAPRFPEKVKGKRNRNR